MRLWIAFAASVALAWLLLSARWNDARLPAWDADLLPAAWNVVGPHVERTAENAQRHWNQMVVLGPGKNADEDLSPSHIEYLPGSTRPLSPSESSPAIPSPALQPAGEHRALIPTEGGMYVLVPERYERIAGELVHRAAHYEFVPLEANK